MIELPLALLEGIHLARIVEDFRELVGEDRDVFDPAVARLVPDVYPDDPAASDAFADSTREDLLDRRLADATTVADALSSFDTEVDALTEADAFAQRTIVIPDADLDAWLRTLTAVRLVLASRLGITDDEQEPDEEERDEQRSADQRRGVYDWLGFRLESLIQAADEED